MRGTAGHARRWLLATVLGAVAACGDDGDPATPAASQTEAAPEAADWNARLHEPDVDDLLAALAQPHARVRPHLGAHRLETTTDFSLRPVDETAPAPRLDDPVVQPQQIHDVVALRWTTDDSGPRVSLSQSNDHERGRDVVVVDETVHVRKTHREWFHYPRDSDLLERWLDDAQRAAHDVIELAAPRLAVTATTVDGAGLDHGAAVELTLHLAEATAADRTAAGPTQGWRANARVEAVEGTVRLDLHHGTWLYADVDVRYRLEGADGRPLRGHVHLRGEVTPDPGLSVEPPTDSRPLPPRLRYDHEQRQLLDGLAAP